VTDVGTRQSRISVVIPSYNSGSYLAAAIDSAIGQVPAPHQVIVQDGGSTDNSLAILAGYGDRLDWRSGPDLGQSDALNKAIERVDGDIVVWLNADDTLAPGAFAEVTRAFAAAPHVELVFGNYDMIGADGRVLRRFLSSAYDPKRFFTRGCYIFSGAMFFRRTLLERIGPFDVSLQTCMDFDYMLRIGDVEAVHIDAIVAGFRMSGEGKSSTMRSRFLREAYRIRSRAAGRSVRGRLLAVGIAGLELVSLYTQPVRLTRPWATLRGRRRL
jgi:glycosyltransferase involved in cell wall biosynthesis